jgi:hypothetical protein
MPAFLLLIVGQCPFDELGEHIAVGCLSCSGYNTIYPILESFGLCPNGNENSAEINRSAFYLG